MKTAMRLIGVPAGDPYPPYVPLTREEAAALEAELKKTVLFANRQPAHADH
jgi:dihydrodipicolinate synthase/N-acetylneuraminate lyase